MILLKPYQDINDTMRHVKIQIVDSMECALNECPRFHDPEDLFYWLKDQVRYENDPKGREKLRTLQTMLYDGVGDCDCFTIGLVALMIAQNWDGICIDLVGRSTLAPVHIYPEISWRGERCVMDMTNPRYCQERDNYKYIQRIPVKWRNW